MRTLSIASFAAMALAVSFTSKQAGACSPPFCSAGFVTPTNGSSIPKTASAIPFHGSGITPTIALGGNVVATTVINDPNVPGWQLLVPSSPLVAGAYTVDYTEPCPAPAKPISHAFTVTDSVAAATTLGSLRGDSAVTGKATVANVGGSCVAEIRALSFDLVLDKAGTVAELLPLTRFQIKVDGALAMETNYGEATRNVNGDVIAGRLVSACDARLQDNLNGPTLGDHFVSVSAHVAGASSDPPSVTAYIRFQCDGGFMNLPMDTDGGLPDADSGTNADHDAGVNHVDQKTDSNATPDSDPGACAMSRPPRASSAVTVLAVALAGIARSIVRHRRTRK